MAEVFDFSGAPRRDEAERIPEVNVRLEMMENSQTWCRWKSTCPKSEHPPSTGREHFLLVTWHHSVVSQLFYPHLKTLAKVLEESVTETQQKSAVDARSFSSIGWL